MPTTPKSELIEIAPGVRTNEAGAARMAETQAAIEKQRVAALPDYDKVRESIDNRIENWKDKNLPGGKEFEAGRDKWEKTRERWKREDEIEKVANREMMAANRNYSDLKRMRRTMIRALRTAERAGTAPPFSPDKISEINDLLGEAAKGRGGAGVLNADEQRKSFINNTRKRLNPYNKPTSSIGKPVGGVASRGSGKANLSWSDELSSQLTDWQKALDSFYTV